MARHEKLLSLFLHGPPTLKEVQFVLRGKRLRNLEEKRDMAARSKSGMTSNNSATPIESCLLAILG